MWLFLPLDVELNLFWRVKRLWFYCWSFFGSKFIQKQVCEFGTLLLELRRKEMLSCRNRSWSIWSPSPTGAQLEWDWTLWSAISGIKIAPSKIKIQLKKLWVILIIVLKDQGIPSRNVFGLRFGNYIIVCPDISAITCGFNDLFIFNPTFIWEDMCLYFFNCAVETTSLAYSQSMMGGVQFPCFKDFGGINCSPKHRHRCHPAVTGNSRPDQGSVKGPWWLNRGAPLDSHDVRMQSWLPRYFFFPSQPAKIPKFQPFKNICPTYHFPLFPSWVGHWLF